MDNKTFNETFLAEIISITGGLLAGLGLAKVVGILEAIPGLIILIPAFLGMRGNISGSLASRIGTALHLGKIKPFERSELLNDNILASFVLTIITSLLIGILANVLSYITGFETAGIRLIYISLLSGVISSAIILPLTVISSFWLYSKNYDPDNIMGPYITTIGDVVSILSLVLIAGVFV